MSSVYAKRFEAVFLCSHPRGPKLKVASAAKVIKKSQSFVKKWVKRFSDSGNVDDLPKRGTARATTKKEDTAIVKMFETNPTLRLRVGKAKLAKKGIRVSINTIRQRLCEKGIQFRSTSLKPLLTETHMEKRRNWAAENISRDWSNWPSQSPDANPIENVWGLLKSKLEGKKVRSLKQLAAAIRKIWRSLPLEYAEKLVESMPKRCQAILDNNGDFTVY